MDNEATVGFESMDDGTRIYLIVTISQYILSVIARLVLFKKIGIKWWKAIIPLYSEALAYRTVGMSGWWIFSQIPRIIITASGLKLPVWLTGLAWILDYGVDFVFAHKFTSSFHKKWLVWILTLFMPDIMMIVAGCSSKFKYDEHYNRIKYHKVGDEFVKNEDVKAAKQKLQEAQRKFEIEQVLAEPALPEKQNFLRKITDGIVKHHKAVLAVMVILALGSAFLATKVNINKDLTKYMPESSETSQGLNIMYSEYEEVLALPLTVMVEDLNAEERATEREYLANLEGVKSLTFEENEEYVRDNQTRFELTVKGKADGENAKRVYDEVKKHYSDLGKNLKLRGEVAMMNTPPLALWVVGIAVLSALVILIIMSESYVEPVLYLASIGLAVMLNMGTNAFLPSVSQVTNSITAVLQLALSMDYSIMLATEFHREKMKGKDKITAMKSALAKSFTAISASSVTTIVGMLVLIMLSFTIGRDLGIVLAKGVLFCLISIFTVLPALLIIFDGLVEKTRKRPFAPKLDLLGEVSYSIRKFSIPIFLVIMVGSFVLQMQVGNLYTNTDSEAIDAVFGPYNQTVVLYDRKDDEKLAEFCHKMDTLEETKRVLCYGNTINEPEHADELLGKFASLGTKVDLSENLIRFLYYHYYDPEETHRITLNQMVEFLKRDDEMLGKFITPEIRNELDRLSLFTNVELANTWRGAWEISQVLNVSWDNMKDLLVLYDARWDRGEQMTVSELTTFVRENILANPKYAQMVPEGIAEKLDLLDLLVKVAAEFDPADFNELDGSINISTSDIVELLEALEVEEAEREKIVTMLAQGRYVLRAAVNGTGLTASDLAENLGVDASSARLIYAMHAQEYGRGTNGMSLSNMIYFLRDYVMNSKFASRLSAEQSTMINAIATIMDENENTQDGAGLYRLLAPLSNKITQDKLELLTIYEGATNNFSSDLTMTVEQVVMYLNDTILQDSRLAELINEQMSQKIIAAKDKIIDAKKQLISENYGRVVILTDLPAEGEKTLEFVRATKEDLATNYQTDNAVYMIGNSAMAYEMSQSFTRESYIITAITALAIYIVVAISFKSWSIPLVLVLMIQTAVWITMTITGFTDGNIYFLALIIVQSLLMGATIDYAIMYTEQYVAARKNGTDVRDSVRLAYNKSIQPILTSAGVLTLVTAIVGNFAGGTAAKICKSISDGTFFSTLLILLMLPAIIAALDKIIVRQKNRRSR